MTHREIRTLEDGTRVYADSHRYKPLSPEERTYAVRKPEDPRAVRWGGEWLLPLNDRLLAPERRILPETVPDDECLWHRLLCKCRVCSRPQANQWRRRARDRERHKRKPYAYPY